MPRIRLNAEWSTLMARYREDHAHPVNRACHTVGIPLIAASLPIGATIVGLPLAAGMFTVGWGFQLVGHAFERKAPSFTGDARQLCVGFLWWLKKTGLADVHEA